MAKRHAKTLKKAIQALLDRKYVDDEAEHTGAELIALVLFAQAQDPTSPHYGKALDIITKLTYTTDKERLQTDKLQIEVTAATTPPAQIYDPDPFSQSVKNAIQDGLFSENNLFDSDEAADQLIYDDFDNLDDAG